MNKPFPLCLELFPQRNSQDRTRESEYCRKIWQSQDQVLQSMSHFDSYLTFSLRYYFDPNDSPTTRNYLIVNQSDSAQTEENYERVLTLLTKGNFSNFFTAKPSDLNNIPNLEWVKIIGEMIKHEELIEQHNYYLPHLWEGNQANDMLSVYEVITRAAKPLILEITLQNYQDAEEKSLWVNAIDQKIAQLHKVQASDSGNKNNLLNLTLSLYQKYQQLYSSNHLFKYAIKVLAENHSDASLVLDTLQAYATKAKDTSKQCSIIMARQGEPSFTESIKATKNIEISTAIEWNGWQKKFAKISIKDAIKPKRQGRLSDFDDGSLDLGNMISSRPSITGGKEPYKLNPSQNQPRDLDIVFVNSALSNISSQPLPRMEDLKPLHRLVTIQEISGFFRIAIPQVIVDINETETQDKTEFTKGFTIKYVIDNYEKYITEDRYVVGIERDGTPCISDFAKIPHRIVAGVPGSGKTNFLNSVIYQFLYANPDRKIYIADFQAGMHYQLIADNYPDNIEMVTELEDCANLLNDLWEQHDRRRQSMREHRVRSLTDLEKKSGRKQHRILLIFDEASFIQHAERKTREVIEKNLMFLAAQSRVTGIHIIYCSQRPTPEVIPRQIADNMDERVIFRVQSAASEMLLDDDVAASLPIEPRGRAVYKGIDPELKIIATPYVPDDIWEQPLR